MNDKESRQLTLIGCGLWMLVLVALLVSMAVGFMFGVPYGLLTAAAFSMLAALYFLVGGTR